MKNKLYLLAIPLTIYCLCSWTLSEKDFHVTVEQFGQIIEPKRNTVKLDKAEFSIVLEFSEPMGLLISGAFDKKTFMLASKNIPKSELPGFFNTGMAEGLLNPNKVILISEDSPSYWFYDDNENHRFDYVETINDTIICKRTIHNFYDVNSKMNMKVENIDKPFYLVFISYKRGANMADEIEVKREFVKIKWKK